MLSMLLELWRYWYGTESTPVRRGFKAGRRTGLLLHMLGRIGSVELVIVVFHELRPVCVVEFLDGPFVLWNLVS